MVVVLRLVLPMGSGDGLGDGSGVAPFVGDGLGDGSGVAPFVGDGLGDGSGVAPFVADGVGLGGGVVEGVNGYSTIFVGQFFIKRPLVL